MIMMLYIISKTLVVAFERLSCQERFARSIHQHFSLSAWVSGLEKNDKNQ